MDDIFADLFRGRGEGFRMPGANVRYRLPVGFLEAVNGARKTVSMPDGKTLDIKIPAGVRDGQVLRLKGQGLPGAGGAPPGDAPLEGGGLPPPPLTPPPPHTPPRAPPAAGAPPAPAPRPRSRRRSPPPRSGPRPPRARSTSKFPRAPTAA